MQFEKRIDVKPKVLKALVFKEHTWSHKFKLSTLKSVLIDRKFASS